MVLDEIVENNNHISILAEENIQVVNPDTDPDPIPDFNSNENNHNEFSLLCNNYSNIIGDWGLGIGDWAQSPIPNPQSPNNSNN